MTLKIVHTFDGPHRKEAHLVVRDARLGEPTRDDMLEFHGGAPEADKWSAKHLADVRARDRQIGVWLLERNK